MQTRKQVERSVDCDTSRLYGDLPTAIAYLQEIAAQYPQASLAENWPGYDTMYMHFCWCEPETDAELAARILSEQQAATRAALEAERKAERKARFKAYLALRDEFS
jgi:hypothetical protein